jgi:hypothetical protein
MKVDKAPLESYADIGGLETQIQEVVTALMRFLPYSFRARSSRHMLLVNSICLICLRLFSTIFVFHCIQMKEAVELPLTHPELFEDIGTLH